MLSRTYTNSTSDKTEKWKHTFFELKKKWTPVKTYFQSINYKQQALGFLLSSSLVFLVGDAIFIWWTCHSNERNVNKAIEFGTRPKLLEGEFILRPELENRLKKIFQLSKNFSSYHVICEEHGTGKTTLARKVVNDIGQGVIYIDFPKNFNDLGKEFGKALNITFKDDTSFTVQLLRKFLGKKGDGFGDSYYKWQRVIDTIKRVSRVYKEKHKKTPVIIYDNVNQLVYQNLKILDILQDDTKIKVDDRIYTVVFINKGSVVRRMQCEYVNFCAFLKINITYRI